MFKFSKKKQETVEEKTFSTIEETEGLEDEYKPEKDIQLLEYILGMKKSGKAIEAAIRLRSRKDIDIIIVVPDGKEKITEIMLESDLYIKKNELQVDIVNRHRNKILVLTENKVTYEIGIIGHTEFESLYNEKKQ